MGHPDRIAKREKKKEKQKEEGLEKKSMQGNSDLTPYNAVNRLLFKVTNISYR
ncbi:MAG: hypothetical protein KGZ96_09665 [Clostridia bacterium]|nr:hypothetical protein [Clostridia bacterium]